MKFKKTIALGLIAIAAYWVGKIAFKNNNKFMVAEIISGRAYDPDFETRRLSQEEMAEVKQAVSQNYTYYGCGGQAFIFFSQDGKHVLKFFKQRHFRQPTHLNYIPFIEKYRKTKYHKRRKRLHLDYRSYKMAFEEMPRETEVIYVHLNKTNFFRQKVHVMDKLGVEYDIDLDTTDFILQRKGELVHSRISNQMAVNDEDGAKKTIDLVIDLIKTRCKKGIRDRDPNIATNCGIFGDHAFKIDVGRFTHDKDYSLPVFYRAEIFALTRPFRIWLTEKHPSLVAHLDERMTQVIGYE